MMVRSVVLFVHIVGMVVLFSGLGLEWLTLNSLRRSTTHEQAVPWLSVGAALPRVIGIARADLDLWDLPGSASRRLRLRVGRRFFWRDGPHGHPGWSGDPVTNE